MADIDKKYGPIVKTDEFKEWVRLLKSSLPKYQLDTVNARVLLFFYLFYKDAYGDTLDISPFFIELIENGWMDIMFGQEITLESYTTPLKDYVLLLRDELHEIDTNASIESMENIKRYMSRLPKLDTVTIIEGLTDNTDRTRDELGVIENAQFVDPYPRGWPERVRLLHAKVDDN